jgi:hypothetical protein
MMGHPLQLACHTTGTSLQEPSRCERCWGQCYESCILRQVHDSKQQSWGMAAGRHSIAHGEEMHAETSLHSKQF